MRINSLLLLFVCAALTVHGEKRSLPEISVEVVVGETFAPDPGEEVAPGRIVIKRTGDTRHALPVRYVVGGSARSGHDYSRLTGSAIIPEGQSEKSIFIEPLPDQTAEEDEKVILVLAAAMHYKIVSPEIATVVIHRSANLHSGDLLNINFGLGEKRGLAGTGKTTNDFWNTMGKAYNGDYSEAALRRSDGSPTVTGARLQNSGGIWGNRSGDPMYDSYVYPNSLHGDGVGNMTLTLSGLSVGKYDLYLYGHGDHITPDNRPEADSFFSASAGGAIFGPVGTIASPLWVVGDGWVEGSQYAVLRNVAVPAAGTVEITVEPGYDGQAGTLGAWDRVAILNGLQLIKR